MKFEELIKKCKDKGYIKIYQKEYGFDIFVENGRLHSLIINTLKNEDHDNLSMWYWSKYCVRVFSCKKFNNYCHNRTKNKEKTIVPNELYDDSMPAYRNDAFEKFNQSNYNYIIEGGWIINKQIQKQKQKRENEINDFVTKIQNQI